jgi:hypothetical protein
MYATILNTLFDTYEHYFAYIFLRKKREKQTFIFEKNISLQPLSVVAETNFT